MSKITKVHIRFGNRSLPIDKYFLDAIAFNDFGKPYEELQVRKEVNTILRSLTKDNEVLHPQIVHQKILAYLIPPYLAKQLDK